MAKQVMVARYSNDGGKTDIGYMLIDSGYNLHVVDTNAVMQLAARKMVENLEVENGIIKSTNGALKRYTCIDANTQKFIGNRRAVILSRIEVDDVLKGYVIFGTNNMVQKISIEKAVDMAKCDMIVNGKLRNTSKGLIVSSIGGEYPIWQIKEKAQAEESIHKVNIVMFRSALSTSGDTIKSVSVVVTYDNALEMRNDCVKLSESNAKLKEALEKEGYGADDILTPKACGNSIACEIRFVDFQSLKRAKNVEISSSFADKGVVVCCRDRNENESAVQVGEKTVVINKGTQETNNGVKSYAAIVNKEVGKQV